MKKNKAHLGSDHAQDSLHHLLHLSKASAAPFLGPVPSVLVNWQRFPTKGQLGLRTSQTEFLSCSITENVKLDLDHWEPAIIIKQKKQTSVLSGNTEGILISSYCLVQNALASAWADYHY